MCHEILPTALAYADIVIVGLVQGRIQKVVKNINEAGDGARRRGRRTLYFNEQKLLWLRLFYRMPRLGALCSRLQCAITTTSFHLQPTNRVVGSPWHTEWNVRQLGRIKLL